MPKTPLKILFLAAEARPFISAGGLGEVAASLPQALRRLPEPAPDVRLAIPFHGRISRSAHNWRPVTTFEIERQGEKVGVQAYETRLEGLPVYAIAGAPIPDAPDAALYENDAALDSEKFTFFSLATLELARRLNWRPDIVHANDWHTAPAIYALALRRGQDAFYAQTATLLGLHNLPYLGKGAGPGMNAYGLPAAPADSPLPWWARNMPLPLGLLSADHIVAVSPGYAQEILTPAFGAGLHDFLNTRAADISGILNGLDTDLWNPASDQALPVTYDANSLHLRRKNKLALQEMLGLPRDPHLPLLIMVTRLDNQKGVDMALEALRKIQTMPWQAVLLGSGQADLEAAARQLQTDLPDKVRALIAYDKALSRKLFGSADILLMPSRYEPCGLTQMIAMRYGCIPVARATGGLRDTIRDYLQWPDSTGFLFYSTDSAALAGAIRRALAIYVQPHQWQALQQRGMQTDFSWERSAAQYLQLYQRLCRNRHGRHLRTI
ncbi:MAG: glycogen synthase GlgA [Anaerolineales bacterium]